jgi:hypothetical protein
MPVPTLGTTATSTDQERREALEPFSKAELIEMIVNAQNHLLELNRLFAKD